MQRLREMQSRSRTAVNRPKEAPPPPPNQEQRQSFRENPRQPHPSPPPSYQNSAQPQSDPLKALLGDLKIDSEKALILLLLFILYKNKSDPKLLLALGYLLI